MEHLDALWSRYVAAEEDRIQAVSQPLLEEVAAAAAALPASARERWARDRARAAVDEGAGPPVRFLLFRALLFPALRTGIEAGTPGCARWLAGLAPLLVKSPECEELLPLELRSEIGLLRCAMEHDPDDAASGAKLVAVLAGQLEFAVHEVPHAVLYSNRAATLDQCRALQAELSEFERLLDRWGSRDEHEELVADCRQHFHRYAAWLERGAGPQSYAEFLGEE